MITLFIFIFGTIIGSGINALDWRTGQDKSWLNDRSECPHCGHALAWWELVPLVSFFVLGRSCSECGKSISWQYPLVELAAGLLFVLIFQAFGISLMSIFAVVIWVLLLLIYVHDGRTMLVPNWTVWLFNMLAFVSLFMALPEGSLQISHAMVTTPGWRTIAAGPILALPFTLIWLLSGGRAMGFADAKIALGIGWLLGVAEGVSAVVYAFWVGAAVSLMLVGFQRLWKRFSFGSQEPSTMETGLSMKSAVPFGPFLILGLLFVYFTGITLL